YQSRPRIVSLPSYPFARMRCWLPEPEAVAAPEIPLYERVWQPSPSTVAPVLPESRVICVFSDHSEPLARLLASRSSRILLVREGGELGDGVPGFLAEADAVRLAESLLAQHDDLAGWLDLADLYRPAAERGLWRARLA